MKKGNSGEGKVPAPAGKKPYSKPLLICFGSVRNMTGGSTFVNIDQFCGSAGNGFEDCFR